MVRFETARGRATEFRGFLLIRLKMQVLRLAALAQDDIARKICAALGPGVRVDYNVPL